MTFWNMFLVFPRKHNFTSYANCLQIAWNVKILFLEKNRKNITNFLSTELAQRAVKVKTLWSWDGPTLPAWRVHHGTEKRNLSVTCKNVKFFISKGHHAENVTVFLLSTPMGVKILGFAITNEALLKVMDWSNAISRDCSMLFNQVLKPSFLKKSKFSKKTKFSKESSV